MGSIDAQSGTTSDERTTAVRTGGATLFGGILLLFIAHCGYERVAGNVSALSAFAGALFVLTVVFLWLKKVNKAPLTFSVLIRRPHLVQTMVQLGVFVYWGTAWSSVWSQMPLITAQICFAYGCEALFSWRRFGHWRFGFGPFPVVLSTNLFLWFVDDYFVLQFLMIGIAYWSRDALCVFRDGRRKHLFNPSAFALGVAAIAVVMFKVPEITHGENIAQTLGWPAHAYLWLFLMGFIVQGFFRVTLITMSAALAMVLAGAVYTHFVGTYYYIDTAIPVAVFLGMNLLVTDPATSPQRALGRVIFGVLYGVLVFVSYGLLREVDGASTITGDPLNISWLDKLLCVPFLNVLAGPIDRLVTAFSKPSLAVRWFSFNRVHMCIWLAAFLAILPKLIDHPGREVGFWESACEQGLGRACTDKQRLYALRCDQASGPACFNHGQALEVGTHVSQDREQALHAYRKACLNGFAPGCLSVYRLCSGSSEFCTADDKTRSIEHACTAGSEQGCQMLARDIVAGKVSGLSISDGVQAFGAGCRAGTRSACAGMHELGVRHVDPKSPKRQPGFARAAFKSACDGAYLDACVNLALMDLRGDGAPKNQPNAEKLLRNACERGHKKACEFSKRLEQASPQ